MGIRIAVVSFSILMLCTASGVDVIAGSAGLNPSALGTVGFRFGGNEEQRNYLGIASDAQLSLAEVKAERLIIVVFNVFCAICQSDAPVLNSVYDVIEGDTQLRGRTKLLGIATGNTEAELEQFQKKYQVPFPLVADPDFDLERAIPENLRTPMIIIARNTDGKALEVVRTHFGAVARVADLLAEPATSAKIDGAYVRTPGE